jgi:acyl-lipid omega-6 desaturase (Delta-12 desaturase)
MPEPSLRELRATFPPQEKRRSLVIGLTLFTGVALVCLGSFAGVLLVDHLFSKVAIGIMLGIAISALFIIGHDACHDSLTPSHKLNAFLGRLCFLPTLHPYVCWELGHNRLHHRWTNLKGADYVYTPFSREEFRALPRWRRAMERIYRTVPGIGLFYFVEIWWKHMIVPRAADFAKLRRGAYVTDLMLVCGFFGTAVICASIGAASSQQAAVNISCAIILPYAVWNWLMAFVTIQHHTHPQSPWFKDVDEWSFFHAQVHGTVHVRLPRWIELVFHNILDHTAHHVDPKIPLYNLPTCQRQLEDCYPADIIIEHSSIPALHRVLRACKLYDYEQHCWLDFRGQTSAPPIPLNRWRRNEAKGPRETGREQKLKILEKAPAIRAASARR